MENRCVCCGAIIPEWRMVCPICEMIADEGAVAEWPGGEEHGRHRTRKNRRKTGRNGKAAVCHLFQDGNVWTPEAYPAGWMVE